MSDEKKIYCRETNRIGNDHAYQQAYIKKKSHYLWCCFTGDLSGNLENKYTIIDVKTFKFHFV